MYIFQPDRTLLRKQVQEVIPLYLRGRVLNVGCGSFERYDLGKNVTEYIRMDIIPNENVDVVSPAESIPFPDGSFDSIISTQVFEHVEHPEKAAGEVARVLKKGGYALITVPQWNELHEEPHDYWRYTKYGLQALFERHGLDLVRIDQRGGFFAARAQMSIRYCIDRFNLYEHPFGGRIANRVFSAGGHLAFWLDRKDSSVANRKHTIGWCAVFKKK